MATGLASLVATGTRLWLDSVDPDLVRQARAAGATGATSNPAIIDIVVVLPAPFGPSRPKISPEATVKLTPSTTQTLP